MVRLNGLLHRYRVSKYVLGIFGGLLAVIVLVGLYVVSDDSASADTAPRIPPEQSDLLTYGATEHNEKYGGTDEHDSFEIFYLYLDGRAPGNLTQNNKGELSPRWSPDGTKIAFFGPAGISIMDADGTHIVNLDVSGSDLAWSPDGSKILYTGAANNSWEIFVVDADGKHNVNLTQNPASDKYPTWSPDGSKIAFVSDRDGNNEIYVMNADGSDLTNLTQNSAIDEYPAWSPDGSKIAFASDRDGDHEIYVMNPDGSDAVALTDNTDFDNVPVWSPDGTKLLLTSDGVYVMNADGSNRINVSQISGMTMWPAAWSPDSSMVAFVGVVDFNNWDVFVVNADGSNLQNISNTPDIREQSVNWRPVAVSK